MTAETLQRRGYNLAEAGKITGASENTLRRELREGRLRFIRAGRRIIISERAIQDWLDGVNTHAHAR